MWLKGVSHSLDWAPVFCLDKMVLFQWKVLPTRVAVLILYSDFKKIIGFTSVMHTTG